MKRILAAGICAACLLSALAVSSTAEDASAQSSPDTFLEENNPVSDRFSEMLDGRSAASFDGIAEELAAVGVFRGTDNGFALEQIPDRLQACTMTVRMLGKEAQALEQYAKGEIVCPFDDVTQDWAKPYLAWLYANKIVLGVGNNKFGNSDCSAQMYVTFMLRALGYSDTANDPDFSFDKALDFAEQRYLYDPKWEETTFDRGEMAAVTYQTLCSPVKSDSARTPDSGTRLLIKLCQSDAIEESAAAPIIQKISVLDGFYEKFTGSLILPTVSFTKTVSAKETRVLPEAAKLPVGSLTSEDAYTFSYMWNPDSWISPDLSFVRNTKTTENGSVDSTEKRWYIKDDCLYVDDGSTAGRLDLTEYPDLYEDSLYTASIDVDKYVIMELSRYYCYFDDCTVSPTLSVYTLDLTNALSGFADDYAQSLGVTANGEKTFDAVYTYQFADGRLKNYGYRISYSLDRKTADGTKYTVLDSLEKDCAYQYDTSITFPDLKGYKDLTAVSVY